MEEHLWGEGNLWGIIPASWASHGRQVNGWTALHKCHLELLNPGEGPGDPQLLSVKAKCGRWSCLLCLSSGMHTHLLNGSPVSTADILRRAIWANTTGRDVIVPPCKQRLPFLHLCIDSPATTQSSKAHSSSGSAGALESFLKDYLLWLCTFLLNLTYL